MSKTRISEAEGEKLIARMGSRATVGPRVGDMLAKIAAKIPAPKAESEKRTRKKRDDGYASQAEADFAEALETLRFAGNIRRWYYEPIKGGLRLNDPDPQTKRNRHYRPDFLVEWSDGYIEWIEVKGRMKWEDAVEKFDWVRAAYPFFHFRMVEKIVGEWQTIRGEEKPQ